MTNVGLDTPRTVEEAVELLDGGPRLVPAGCEACREAFLVGERRVGQPCPACHQGELERQGARIAPVQPELFVDFAIGPDEVKKKLSSWVRSFWFRTGDLQEDNLVERLEKVWVPTWLVDATVDGNWQAEVGFNYEVQSTVEKFANGSWSSHEVTETRIRWEPRAGTLVRRPENVPVQALSRQEDIERLVGGLSMEGARRMRAASLEDSLVWLPDLRPESAWPAAEHGLKLAVGAEVKQAAAAEHFRELYLTVEHIGMNWTWMFVPVYTTWYTDGRQRFSVYINGRTGKIGGPRIASNIKGFIWASVIVGIAACIGALGVITAVIGIVAVPLLVVAAILIVIAFLICLVALWPALKPWLWNRSQWALQPLQSED